METRTWRDLEQLIEDRDFLTLRNELSHIRDADIAVLMEELRSEACTGGI